MSLFDAYIFIDWSAASGPQSRQPTANAVWVGEFVPGLHYQQETYHRTRKGGIAHVTSVLEDHVKERRRVLVGFDFPYGYPAGFASALTLPVSSQSWLAVWAELADRVQDTGNNISNRFVAAGEVNTIMRNGNPGPFWGVSSGYGGYEFRSSIAAIPL